MIRLKTRSVASVVAVAVASRLAVLALAIFFGNLVTDYDSSAELAYTLGDHVPETSSSRLDSLVKKLVGMLAPWDGIYFTGIAMKGYVFEQYHAFFPLLPLATRAISSCAPPFVVVSPLFLGSLSLETSILLSGVLLSNFCFVIAAVSLYKLTLMLFESADFAFAAAVAFSFNPASIFMSAFYTESLFVSLIFTGLFLLYRGNVFGASLLFALATACRSNGVVLVGFIAQYLIAKSFQSSHFGIGHLLATCLRILGWAFVVVSPFLAFLYYGYSMYCTNLDARPWCNSRVPNLYSFVQSEYWGVGFLRYYEFKQIPNFLLAAPALGLSFHIFFSYLYRHAQNLFSLQFIFDYPRTSKPLRPSGRHLDLPPKPSEFQWQSNSFLFPFALHLLFLALTGLFFMHVQVSTRFLFSQSPLLYWFIADIFLNPKSNHWLKAGLFLFLAVFIVVGTALFTNFLPWT